VKNRKIAALLLAALFSGCASPQPAAQQYILSPKINVKPLQQSRYKTKTLKVLNVYTQNSLKTRNMFYVEQGRKKYAYSQSKWAESPQSMLHSALMQMLQKSAAFGYVQSQKSKVLSDFVLETRVDDFGQYFIDDSTKAFGRIILTLTLIDAKKHTIIASKTLSAEANLEQLNAAAGARALNSALESILQEASLWIEGVAQ